MIFRCFILLLSISRIHATKSSIGFPSCDLDPALLSLNTNNIKRKDILNTITLPGSSLASDQSHYERPKKSITLGYVTPWNNHGYDIAKWFASKFTHISPVWYQLILEDGIKPILQGGHDVDQSWLQELRTSFRSPKIVPRVQLQFSQKAAEAILYYPQGHAEAIIDVLLSEVENYGYDGLTLELPAPHAFIALIGRIGDALHDLDKELILVVPPQHQLGVGFDADHISALANEVDYFSVMTYDHAVSIGQEGPNSPLPWIKEVVEGLVEENEEDGDEVSTAGQVLMGVPFYGYMFEEGKNPGAFTASNYLALLKGEGVVIKWDEDAKEHVLVHGGRRLWYPSLLSLLYRLQLAEELGVGIAIWELGQGLDCFIDVL